jgi:hypothetical protein
VGHDLVGTEVRNWHGAEVGRASRVMGVRSPLHGHASGTSLIQRGCSSGSGCCNCFIYLGLTEIRASFHPGGSLSEESGAATF